MNSPLISIVIVVYNGEETLKHTIESVLSQTYKNLELVIIDGGSKDNTVIIIKSYGAQIAYSISEKDNGIYDAMNKGIQAAKGEWLLFLGADDLLYNNTILADIFADNNWQGVDFLYGDVEFVSNKKRFGGEKNYKRLIERNLCHQGIFYKKNIFEKIGIYNTRYAIVADHEMNIRIFRDGSLQKKYLAPIITLFNDKGTSNDIIDKHFHGDMLDIFLHKDKMPFFAPELQQYHFYYGLVNLLNKNYAIAFKHIPASWIRGKRKLFYFLFTGKFLLKIMFRKKIRLK
jgi:glycosyltransferase involved in cell wall biosynthesis